MKRVKTVLLSLFASLSLLAAVGGCGGGADPVAACNATCDKVAACSMGATTADKCKMDADCAHAKSTCKNTDAIINCFAGCNAGTCDNLLACQAACPACQQPM